MPRRVAQRARSLAAGIADRLLTPATRAELLGLFLVLVVVVAVAAGVIYHDSVKQDQLTTAQLRSCSRLNLVRAQDNKSHLDDYRFDTAVAALIKTGLTQPQVPNTALTVKQRKDDLTAVEMLAAQLRGSAESKEWTPLTLCYPATFDPLHYVPPSPIPFKQELPPPSALTPGPGE